MPHTHNFIWACSVKPVQLEPCPSARAAAASMDLLAAISDGGRGDCHSNFGADESTSDIQEVSCVTDRGAGEGKRRRVDVKQQYACKVGVGVQGIAIAEAEGILGAAAATTLSKTCCFCSCAVGEPDPLDCSLTRAWHKPRFEGKVCAYCGRAAKKLFPAKAVKEVHNIVSSSQEPLVLGVAPLCAFHRDKGGFQTGALASVPGFGPCVSAGRIQSVAIE